MSKVYVCIAFLCLVGGVFSTMCKDGSTCPGVSTCCLAASGGVGCCPYQNANCCGDGLHCCPSGYQCDTKSNQCKKGASNDFLSFLKLEPSTKPVEVEEKKPSNGVQCDETGVACPNKTTCCAMEGGQWGCCPYDMATCCDDKQSCCPNGYACNVAEGSCERSAGNDFLTFLSESDYKMVKTFSAIPSPKDLYKCISSISPVIKDITQLVELWNKGDDASKAKIKEVLLKLSLDGYSLGVECWKVIQSIIKSD